MILSYEVAGWLEKVRDPADCELVCPVFAISKPDGSFRMIYDARRSNKYWQTPTFELPNHFMALSNPTGYFYIKSDLSNAFMHWPLHEDVKRKCGVIDVVTNTYYRWNVLPWGTNIAPFIQQTIMISVCSYLARSMQRDEIDVRFYVYYDDFLI